MKNQKRHNFITTKIQVFKNVEKRFLLGGSIVFLVFSLLETIKNRWTFCGYDSPKTISARLNADD